LPAPIRVPSLLSMKGKRNQDTGSVEWRGRI